MRNLIQAEKYLFDFTLFFLVALSGIGLATPSTQIWNPSTDIQPAGTVHFGIDNYFTLEGPAEGGYAFPTDTGITYGLFPNFEVGADVFLPQSSPFVFNAKCGMPESGGLPSLAVGGFGFGTAPSFTDQNVLYAVAAKSFPIGRLSFGYYKGNEKVLVPDSSGFILTWDKNLNDKIWASVDYASGKSALGAAFWGFSYLFAPNTSVIFGYGTYNNGAKPTATTQLDINL